MNEKYTQQILKYGLITGALLSVYIVLVYVLEVNLFQTGFAFLSFFLTVLILLIPMVKSIHTINRSLESPMLFGGKFLTAFMTGFMGLVIYGVINYILFYVVDPEYMKEMVAEFIVNIGDKLERAGLSEQQIETQMAKIVRQTEAATQTGKAIQSSLISALLYPLALGLIVAAAVNTKKHHQDKMFIMDESGE